MSVITNTNFNRYRIRLRASVQGSIGTKYGELRLYLIVAKNEDDACDHARELAYREGLEHTLITNIAAETL